MTAQFLTLGSDGCIWGNVLNEFLLVSHNGDGTPQSGAISNAGSITPSQLGTTSGVPPLVGVTLA